MIDPNQYTVTKGPLTLCDTYIIEGANYFSWGPVVVFSLDLGEFDEVFTNTIPNFSQTLMRLLPSMHEHHCSPGRPGGFFERLQDGTLLGHVAEHVIIELQTMAGMDVGFGKTRLSPTPGVYNVVFRFFNEAAGFFAGKAGINLINALLEGKSFDIPEVVKTLSEIWQKTQLHPVLNAVAEEADYRRIPVFRSQQVDQVVVGSGKYQKQLQLESSDDVYHVTITKKSIHHLQNSTEIEDVTERQEHLTLRHKEEQKVGKQIVDQLFPQEIGTHVPLFSVTGSVGVATASQLLRHGLQQRGLEVGAATSQGLFVNRKLQQQEDATLRPFVTSLLKDPTLNSLVIESPLETILSHGLGYSLADFGIILNLEKTDFDNKNIRLVDLDDVAYAHALVVEEIYPQGYAILNADVGLIREMEDRIDSRLIWFSQDSKHKLIRSHMRKNGISVVLDGKSVVILEGRKHIRVINLNNVPFYSKTPGTYSIDILLASVAAFHAFGLSLEVIQESLTSFGE